MPNCALLRASDRCHITVTNPLYRVLTRKKDLFLSADHLGILRPACEHVLWGGHGCPSDRYKATEKSDARLHHESAPSLVSHEHINIRICLYAVNIGRLILANMRMIPTTSWGM